MAAVALRIKFRPFFHGLSHARNMIDTERMNFYIEEYAMTVKFDISGEIKNRELFTPDPNLEVIRLNFVKAFHALENILLRSTIFVQFSPCVITLMIDFFNQSNVHTFSKDNFLIFFHSEKMRVSGTITISSSTLNYKVAC